MLDDDALHAIGILKQHFSFTQADKMNSAFAVICKVKVAEDMINDLIHSPTYTAIPDTQEDISFTLRSDLVDKFRLVSSLGSSLIPPYFPIWKAHSDKFRFIVGANKSPLKFLYLRMADIFKAITPHLRRI